MAPRLVVLVPPSEAKTRGGTRRRRVGAFDASLGALRSTMTESLHEALEAGAAPELERMLHARGELLERAIEATRSLSNGAAVTLPAWRRYCGVVWTHLEPSSLSAGQRGRIIVPSGLYGLSAGNDPVADYRLRMDVMVRPLGNVAAYWRPHLARALADHVGATTIVNLLPAQHQSALDFDELRSRARVVDVAFVQGNGAGAAGHDAKAVKGVVARRLLQQGIRMLAAFEWEGWSARRVGDLVTVTAPAARPPGRATSPRLAP